MNCVHNLCNMLKYNRKLIFRLHKYHIPHFKIFYVENFFLETTDYNNTFNELGKIKHHHKKMVAKIDDLNNAAGII